MNWLLHELRLRAHKFGRAIQFMEEAERRREIMKPKTSIHDTKCQIIKRTNVIFEQTSKVHFTSVMVNISKKQELLVSKLRIIDNLIIAKKTDGVVLQASLVCDCKGEYFHVTHTGKQTRGIFRPLLIKSNKQISIVCRCKNCGKELKVYDSTTDGVKPLNVEKTNYTNFTLKSKNAFKITLYYNYQKEDYMTDRFVDCFIHIASEDDKETVLFEGW